MRNALFGLYVGLCLLAMIWPGYAWLGARIEPRLLGVPFSLVWIIGWVLLTFAVFVAYDVTRPRKRSDSGSNS